MNQHLIIECNTLTRIANSYKEYVELSAIAWKKANEQKIRFDKTESQISLNGKLAKDFK